MKKINKRGIVIATMKHHERRKESLENTPNKGTLPGNKDPAKKKDKEKRRSVESLHQHKALSFAALNEAEHEEESNGKDQDHIFAVLSKADSESLHEMTAQGMESFLQEKFELSPVTNIKDAAILDYYVGAAYWAKAQDYTPLQYSGFFCMMHKLLHFIMEDHLDLVDLIKEFRKLLIGIGVDFSSTTSSTNIESGGFEIFTTEQAKAITDYVYLSLFQHQKLYEYMFTHSQNEEIVSHELNVVVPMPAEMPFPPPLDEGIREDTIENYLDIPIPTVADETEEGGAESEPLDTAPITPAEVELPPGAEDIFAKLSPEEVSAIIQEVSGELLKNLQGNVIDKIRTQENLMLAKINKVHVVAQSSEADTDSK